MPVREERHWHLALEMRDEIEQGEERKLFAASTTLKKTYDRADRKGLGAVMRMEGVERRLYMKRSFLFFLFFLQGWECPCVLLPSVNGSGYMMAVLY